jgi:hypothetical protein
LPLGALQTKRQHPQLVADTTSLRLKSEKKQLQM